MYLRSAMIAVLIVLLPSSAFATCLGFFNATEQGFKLEGDRLEPSGPKVAAGTQFEFNGISQIRDKFYLTQARSDLIYDSENIELTSGCNLPTVAPPTAQ